VEEGGGRKEGGKDRGVVSRSFVDRQKGGKKKEKEGARRAARLKVSLYLLQNVSGEKGEKRKDPFKFACWKTNGGKGEERGKKKRRGEISDLDYLEQPHLDE